MSIDIKYFKKRLEEEKESLLKELNSLGVPDKDVENNWDVTPSDREEQIETHDELADRMENLEEREATKIPLEERLKEVNHALKKIEAGTYGFCEVDQNPIELDRLEANPAARTGKGNINEILPPIIE